METVICEWCYHERKLSVAAKWVVCTGRIDTMKIKEFFICDNHADLLTTQFRGRRGMIAGVTFDEWELHWVTEEAREFHTNRTVERFNEAARKAGAKAAPLATGGYIPYSITQPDPWSVQRRGWFHRDTGKIRKSVPIH
jgi:hypothetical protein